MMRPIAIQWDRCALRLTIFVVVVCFFFLLFFCVLFICCVFVVAVAVMLLFGISRCCRWYALQMDRYCFVFIYFSIFYVSVRLLLAPGPPLLVPSIAEFFVMLFFFAIHNKFLQVAVVCSSKLDGSRCLRQSGPKTR